MQFGLLAVRPGGDNHRRFGSHNETGVLRLGQEDQGLVKHVSGFDVGDQKDVCMTGAGICNALMPGGLRRNGIVQGQRTHDGAARQAPRPVGLHQSRRIQGGGHLGIDLFHSA